MRVTYFYLACVLSKATASLMERDDCQTGYTLCAPAGASSAVTPKIGSDQFSSLYVDIVSSSLPPATMRDLQPRGASLCCNALLSCLVMQGLSIPFCYDKFTTNYFLPDSSYGTVVGGAYTSADGTANLQSGDFTLANGTTGNIYAANPAQKPNLATLPIPTQYTATGVGPVIPANSLGVIVTVTYTTTLPGVTRQGTTIEATTAPASTRTQTVVQPTTVTTSVSNTPVTSVLSVTAYSQILIQASAIPGTTVLGTTQEAKTTVVTTTQLQAAPQTAASSAASSAAVSPTTSKAGAVGGSTIGIEGAVLAVLVGLGGWLI